LETELNQKSFLIIVTLKLKIITDIGIPTIKYKIRTAVRVTDISIPKIFIAYYILIQLCVFNHFSKKENSVNE